MKGVNKQVIEISQPESEYIEKVLVFLRQRDGRVNPARARTEAEEVVSSLVRWRRFLPWIPRRRLIWLGGAAAAAVAAVLLLAF